MKLFTSVYNRMRRATLRKAIKEADLLEADIILLKAKEGNSERVMKATKELLEVRAMIADDPEIISLSDGQAALLAAERARTHPRTALGRWLMRSAGKIAGDE